MAYIATKTKEPIATSYVSTTNACKLCRPIGACLAFKGIEGAVPFLHGSQGCATYMRRYIISHFNEPIDIASSSLGEKHAVYGGQANLKLGLINVMKKYRPRMIGIATTCLTETIGDDVPQIIKAFFRETRIDGNMPILVPVSTPSYAGTHMEGFHGAVKAVVENLATGSSCHDGINIFPGFVSPADIRYLKEITGDFGLDATILPDISETLDGPAMNEYPLIPRGGTPISSIRRMGGARATLELGRTISSTSTAGDWLERNFKTKRYCLGLPIGIRETDRFFAILEDLSGNKTPGKYIGERERLIDSLVDGHKYVFGKRAVIYGEEDLVIALTAFMAEIGVKPVLCASGGKSGLLAKKIRAVTQDLLPGEPQVMEGADFFDISQEIENLAPDLIMGHSKGYGIARRLGIPLIRVGFPIHDRIGGQRILLIGYRGAQGLFDLVANAMIQAKQDGSSVGYGYM